MSPYKMSKIEESIRITLSFIDKFNQKKVDSIVELIHEDCVFEDIWEIESSILGKQLIINYLINQFNKFPMLKYVVTDANNLVHKCIVKYNCYGIFDSDEKYLKCIGIFEVKNKSITSISLYSKK